MHKSAYSKDTINSNSRGFALVLSLALISFVFLLVITLVSQVRQDMAYSDARENLILAKANARLGMMIAIGEIQKHLGPDMRVSATADIYDERIESSMDFISSPYPKELTAISNAVDLDEDNTVDTIPFGQRMWTGVWKHRGHGSDNFLDLEKSNNLATRALPYNSDSGSAITESWSVDTSYDHHPAVEQAWLVSGNEGWQSKLAILGPNGYIDDTVEVPDGIYIDDEGYRLIPGSEGGVYGVEENAWRDHRQVVTNHLKNYFHPLSAIPNPDDDDSVAWLLKSPVTGGDGNYSAEPVKAPKSEITGDSGKKTGNYAYWVGDQGVLSKINIPEIPELSNESRLKVASSPNFQALNLDAGDLGNLKSLSFLADTERVSSMDYNETMEWAAVHYHDITLQSYGVLSDARTGGLRRDLSFAFSDNKNDQEWKTDFENNWIFRDKISYKKEFPLNTSQVKANFTDPFTSKIHKNQWLYGDEAPVNDEDALLAGPLWSVLYDYHNLTEPTLEVTPPTQFPRIVGDNSVIFKPGESPAPAVQFPKKANKATWKFFNSFKDENDNAIRPEPQNHPITPILSRIKLNLNLAISNPSTMEVNLVITPTVSLWNPYDKPLRVKDLYLTWTPADISFALFKFDLGEYDLFRKWWMYFSKPQSLHGSQNWSAKMADDDEIKNWNKPWPAFTYTSNDDKIKEFGVLSTMQARDTSWVQGLKMGLIKKNGKWVYPHDYPVDGLDPEFVFHSFEDTRLQNMRFKMTTLHLKLEETTLSPGEAVGFGVKLEETDYKSGEPMRITLKKGEEDEALLIKTGFKDFSFGGYDVKYSGMSGIGDGASDSIIYEQNGFGYSPVGNFFIPGIAMYKWEGGQETFNPEDPRKAKKIYSCAYDMSDVIGRADQAKLTTGDWLLQAWQDRNDQSEGRLPGQSISLEMVLPGEKRNERITLNDFNLRHLIHGQQQGMGSLYYTRYPRKSDHVQGGVGSSVKGAGEHVSLAFKDGEDEFTLKTPLEPFNPASELYENKFNIPTGDGKENFYSERLSFPDLFAWTGDEFDATNQTIIDFNNATDLTARMQALGFVQGSQYNLYTDSDYPMSLFLEPETFRQNYSIRRWGDINSNAGFYLDAQDEFLTEKEKEDITDSPEAVKNAVLFETPKETILSLLQYRHANLNSYLHGPSYALGNSYASTQVGRHRSYGRNQTILYRPTSAGGLTVNDIKNMDKFQDQYMEDVAKNPLAKAYKKSKESFSSGLSPREIFGMHNWGANGDTNKGLAPHDIDFNQGFAPWRNVDSGAQLSHQNITIDHSYYLNRSLLDGYFLSGYNSGLTFSPENHETGLRLTPYLYTVSDNEKVGNPRLIAYLGEGHLRQAESSDPSEELIKEPESYQSLAGDILVDGAFNINSTSVDAWVSQLSSLRGVSLKRASGADVPMSPNETPVVRFLNEPDNSNSWNTLRKLSDEEVLKLAKSMVKEVKFRGPFLSFSDFVNRRLAPGPQDPRKAKGSFVNFMKYELSDWGSFKETPDTVTGLRGAVQNAIANAGLNDTNEWGSAGGLPMPPISRWSNNSMKISKFGLVASSVQEKLWNGGNQRWWGLGALDFGFETDGQPKWAPGDNFYGKKINPGGDLPNIPFGELEGYQFKPHKETYLANHYGEAQENFLAVEHLASAANKPGWVMQSDILSPLAPVSTARSDTFIVRISGESFGKSVARSWIEAVVQRTPDYVKADIDSPHHRPHEPFKDVNLNGYWDNDANIEEHWIDLNRNGNKVNWPDLPGAASSKFRDGMPSDLRLNLDSQEESTDASGIGVSLMGINQRFGRKFKIVSFRWLREQDV